jgi:hypothetical protein
LSQFEESLEEWKDASDRRGFGEDEYWNAQAPRKIEYIPLLIEILAAK